MKSAQAKLFGKLTFLLMGISSLIGWNGVLTALDFYSQKYPNFNVNFILTIPFTLAQNIMGLLIYKISVVLTMNQRIIGGSILLSISLITLPLIGQFVEGDKGFYICLVISFITGLLNTLVQGSAMAFASIFTNQNYIQLFLTGTGLAGVLICCLKIIFLLTIDQELENSLFWMTQGYIIVAAIFLWGVIYFYIKFKKTNYCKYYIKVSKQQSVIGHASRYSWIKPIVFDNKEESKMSSQKSSEDLIDPNQEEGLNNTVKYQTSSLKLDKKEQDKADIQFLKQVFKKLNPLPINILCIYTFTFMLFPGVSFQKKFYWDLEIKWIITILLLIYNIFDTIGKIASQYVNPTRNLAKFSTYIRILFFVSFFSMITPTIENSYVQSDIFSLVNMAIFAFTNGFATSINMGLGPQLCNDEEKETAGFMLSFPLGFGILLGSFLALSFQNIGK